MKDFYAVLGVPEHASPDVIKVAYRKLAMQHHPDLNQADPAGAEDRMKQINEAYDILGKPEKRQVYDMQRHPVMIRRVVVMTGFGGFGQATTTNTATGTWDGYIFHE
jgi:curved DNA-binding protein CbpA